jgi:hypothetical protein
VNKTPIAHQLTLSFVKGLLVGGTLTLLLHLTGIQVPFLGYMALYLILSGLVSLAFSASVRRQWNQVVDSYYRPAYGEDADTSGQQPKDSQ